MDERTDENAIHNDIGCSLIAATPEDWTYARLTLVASHEDGVDACSHVIENPDFPSDCIIPTDELMAATRELELLYQRRGRPWSSVVFEIRQNEDGEWGFDAEFEYLDK